MAKQPKVDFTKVFNEEVSTALKTVDTLTNAELAHNMRWGPLKIEHNVFYTLVDMSEIHENAYPYYGFSNVEMLMLAKARYSEKKSPNNKIATLLHECSNATLTPQKIILAMPAVQECTRFFGTYLPEPVTVSQKNLVREEDYVRPILTLYRPVLNTQTGKLHAVVADPSGEIFPKMSGAPPAAISNMYSAYKTVTDCVTQFAADAVQNTVYDGKKRGQAAEQEKLFLAKNKIALTSLYGQMWQKNYAGLKLTHAQQIVHEYTNMRREDPPANYVNILKEYNIKASFQPKYAAVPVPVGTYTIREALSYLLASRAIRGENAGIARLTTNYFYGDIPVHLYRSVTLAHSIKHIYQSLVQSGVKLDGVFLHPDAFKNMELVELNVPLYGFSKHKPFVQGASVLVLDSINRTISRSKTGKLSYDLTFANFEISMATRKARIGESMMQHGVSMHYAVQTLVCEAMFNDKARVVRTMHAHSGRVWYIPKVEIAVHGKKQRKRVVAASDELAQKNSSAEIAMYILAANLHKNFYPFHRTPLFVQGHYKGSITLVERAERPIYNDMGFVNVQKFEGTEEDVYEYEKRVAEAEVESRAEHFPAERANYVAVFEEISQAPDADVEENDESDHELEDPRKKIVPLEEQNLYED